MAKSGAEILQEAFDRLVEAGPPERGSPPVHMAEPGYVVDCLRVPPQRTVEEEAGEREVKAYTAYVAYCVTSGAEEQIRHWHRRSLLPIEIRDRIEELMASALRPEIQIKLAQELLVEWQFRLKGVDPDGPLVGLPQPAAPEERPFTPNKWGEHD